MLIKDELSILVTFLTYVLVKSYSVVTPESVTDSGKSVEENDSSLYRFYLVYTPFPLITLPLGATFAAPGTTTTTTTTTSTPSPTDYIDPRQRGLGLLTLDSDGNIVDFDEITERLTNVPTPTTNILISKWKVLENIAKTRNEKKRIL